MCLKCAHIICCDCICILPVCLQMQASFLMVDYYIFIKKNKSAIIYKKHRLKTLNKSQCSSFSLCVVMTTQSLYILVDAEIIKLVTITCTYTVSILIGRPRSADHINQTTSST